MSDLEILYAVMAAFYVWESLAWLPSNATALACWWGSTFHITRPLLPSEGLRAALVMSPLTPRFGTLTVGSDVPLILSPRGIFNREAARGFVCFDDRPQFTAKHKRVLVNGDRFTAAASDSHARWLAAELNRLAKLPDAKREPAAKAFIQDPFDSKAATQRWRQFQKESLSVSWSATALFGFVFLFAPAIIWRLGLELTWPWLLGGLVALCVVNALWFRKAHLKLHPELDDERFAQFIMGLLFPPAGMRVRDLLSRPLLERFHPLTLTAALGDQSDFTRLARQTVLDLEHPRPTAHTAPDMQLLEQWHLAVRREAVRTLLNSRGLQLDSLLVAPERTDSECRSYCPRCRIQFTLRSGRCPDCGVELALFPET